MSTTGMVMTVTDELLAELDRSVRAVWHDKESPVVSVDALTSELRRLRADNAVLAQSLAESRANDRAAMGWLTSLRWASGDRGERMLPELVTHIGGLAKDSGRYRWLRDNWFQIYGESRGSSGIKISIGDIWNHAGCADHVDAAIDAAMATQ